MERKKALKALANEFGISEDDIRLAQGISLLTPEKKAFVEIIINDNIASESDSPSLKKLYSNASPFDQARFDRMVSTYQDSIRPSN